MIIITITKSAPKGLNLIIYIELFNPFRAVVFYHAKPWVSPTVIDILHLRGNAVTQLEFTNLSRFMGSRDKSGGKVGSSEKSGGFTLAPQLAAWLPNLCSTNNWS